MLRDLKNTISQSAIYGLSRIAAKLISFVLIPLYTSLFIPDTIAHINMLESFWQYLFVIVMFGVETAIVNFCAKENDSNVRGKLLFSFYMILIFNSAAALLLGYFLSGSIASLIFNGIGSNVIFYCFLISVFEAMLIMPLTISRINNKPLLYTAITVSGLLINLSLQLIFLLVLNKEFDFIFVAKFIAPAVLTVVFIPYVLKNINFEIDSSGIKKILKFCFPLMLAALVSILLNSVDRFILSGFVSNKDVAVYTTGYSLGNVTNAFILAPFTLAINIMFWKKIDEDNFLRFMTKTSTYLFSGMIFVSVLISFFAVYGVKIFVRNPELWSSVNIIPFILLANCFTALFTFHSLNFYYDRNTNPILIIMCICLAFSVLANFILIRYFGIFASAFIAVCSSLLMIFLGSKFTGKNSFTKFEKYKITLISILYIVFVYLSFAVSFSSDLADIALKLAMIFLFILILYILKFFEPVEIERIKGFFNKYMLRKFR